MRTSTKALIVITGTTGFFALGAGVASATVLDDAPSLGDLGERAPQLLDENVVSPMSNVVSVDPGWFSTHGTQYHAASEGSAPEDVLAGTPTGIIEELAGVAGPLGLGESVETLPMSATDEHVDLPWSPGMPPTHLDPTAFAEPGTVPQSQDDSSFGVHQVRPDLVELHEDTDDTGILMMAAEEEPPTDDTGRIGVFDGLVTIEDLPEVQMPFVETKILPQSAESDLSQIENSTDPAADLLPVALV